MGMASAQYLLSSPKSTWCSKASLLLQSNHCLCSGRPKLLIGISTRRLNFFNLVTLQIDYRYWDYKPSCLILTQQKSCYHGFVYWKFWASLIWTLMSAESAILSPCSHCTLGSRFSKCEYSSK
ncbi:hypothetical protein Y1Q_0013687 [Alligator mississippiensis]|uniref:Uncharacterized protein n=1 Tax=Alligator mississippiensis TaxID=8496 RepID=A0A151P3S1_ALLMI|nr:hypothetical protein Y1Q_0013687 [Alligator mississippiensis]